jgi:hypothetical protein
VNKTTSYQHDQSQRHDGNLNSLDRCIIHQTKHSLDECRGFRAKSVEERKNYGRKTIFATSVALPIHIKAETVVSQYHARNVVANNILQRFTWQNLVHSLDLIRLHTNLYSSTAGSQGTPINHNLFPMSILHVQKFVIPTEEIPVQRFCKLMYFKRTIRRRLIKCMPLSMTRVIDLWPHQHSLTYKLLYMKNWHWKQIVIYRSSLAPRRAAVKVGVKTNKVQAVD